MTLLYSTRKLVRGFSNTLLRDTRVFWCDTLLLRGTVAERPCETLLRPKALVRRFSGTLSVSLSLSLSLSVSLSVSLSLSLCLFVGYSWGTLLFDILVTVRVLDLTNLGSRKVLSACKDCV